MSLPQNVITVPLYYHVVFTITTVLPWNFPCLRGYYRFPHYRVIL